MLMATKSKTAKASKAASNIAGALTGLYGNILTGWALNPADPEQRLVVEIYVDGAWVGVIRADQEQPADVEGDGFHGFSFAIKQQWLQNARSINTRIANKGPWLEQTITLPVTNHAGTNALPPEATRVYHSGGLCLKGWAYDPANPGQVLSIRARMGDTIYGTATAEQPAPALVHMADADHGFTIDLPWSLADGETREIVVETTNGQPLTGSPITLCGHPEGLEALIRQHWPKGGDTRNLLLALARQHDRRYPGCCSLELYPEWYAQFAQPEPLSNTTGKVFILLLGNASDPEDEIASLASIQQQRLPQAQIEVLAPNLNNLNSGELIKTLKAALKDSKTDEPNPTLIVPLQIGDRLAPHALDTLLKHITEHGADWGYADCDQDTEAGKRSNPWLKPAWDATLFESIDLVTPGGAFSANSIHQALKNHPAKATWPQLLKAIVQADAQKVLHIPQVLYHRSSKASALPDITPPQWPEPKAWPTVSLIVPTRDQLNHLKPCIEGLLNHTDYPHLEIIVVDNDSHEPDTLAYLKQIQMEGVSILRYPKAFNYAAINNWAVAQASGDIIGLINNDIAVIEPHWLKTLVTQLLRPQVGAVGAKLLWHNGMVQHGGVVVGTLGLAAHTGNNLNQDDAGYLHFNQVTREQSAVTAACLLVRKADYQALGGLDADKFPVTFNDVDFCLRLRNTGKKIVWSADAVLTHAESASRGKEDKPDKQARARREQANFIKAWQVHLTADRYYHPALANDYLNGPYGALACPPGPFTPRL